MGWTGCFPRRVSLQRLMPAKRRRSSPCMSSRWKDKRALGVLLPVVIWVSPSGPLIDGAGRVPPDPVFACNILRRVDLLLPVRATSSPIRTMRSQSRRRVLVQATLRHRRALRQLGNLGWGGRSQNRRLWRPTLSAKTVLARIATPIRRSSKSDRQTAPKRRIGDDPVKRQVLIRAHQEVGTGPKPYS
jgi:hypothetical protein